MEKFFGNIRDAFRSEQDLGDNAGFIDEILFIVGIALAAVAVSSWIGGAAMNKGVDIATCIEAQNVNATKAGATKCATTNTSVDKKKAVTDDSVYKGRYGAINLIG